MSHRETQKWVTRLLYDPSLFEKVRVNPGLLQSLSPEERSSLLSIDPRALRADTLRRRRTMKGLVDELKLSTTLILSEWRSFSRLEEGFFTSERFHKAISKDSLLVSALASFLEDECTAGRIKHPHAKELLRYEGACIQSRRAPALQGKSAPIQEKSVIKKAPGLFGMRFSFDVIAVVQHIEKYLFELSLFPQLALCEDALTLTTIDIPQQEKRLLMTPTGGGFSLSGLDAGLYALLQALSAPTEARALYKTLAPFGVPPKQVLALLSALQSEGVLSAS
jgi:hypothetical protein